MKQYGIILVFLLTSTLLFSQTITLSNGDNGVSTLCSATFVDDGGVSGNYSPNFDGTITFCPDMPNEVISVAFDNFNTEGGGGTCTDFLRHWNGNDSSGTPDNTFCGNLGSFVVNSTSSDGCVTFQFISNGTVNNGGWEATVSCLTTGPPPVAALVDTSIVDVCAPTATNAGDLEISFDASNSTSAAGTTITTYEWIWGDGTISTTNTPMTSHTFPGTGIYEVLLSVRDDNTDFDPLGNQSTNSVSRLVRVMPEPNFTGTSPNTINVNCGETVSLEAVVASQTSTQGSLSVSGSPISLPDGTGVNYESQINFSGLFPAGATMTSDCYPTISFDIEHSFTGDLDIFLIAPSGEIVQVFNQIGGDNNFGTCVNGADDLRPGCTARYEVADSGGANWGDVSALTGSTSNCTIYNGVCEGGNYYVPQLYNSVNSFNAIDGAELNGIWTLRIRDNLAQDDGVISAWSISFPQTCFGNSESVTPEIVSATWTHSGTGPALPTQNTTNTAITDPGPDDCPVPGTCIGNQLINSPTIGPFTALGSYVYTLTAIDEFGCEYERDITVNVAPNNSTPTFNAIPPICSGDPNPLVLVSNEGIVGTWAPAFNNSVTTQYTFTPDPGECTTGLTMLTITISPEPVGTDATEAVCSDEALAHDLTGDVDIASTFSWEVVSNTGATGASVGVQTTGSITDVLNNMTTTDQTVVYEVTPTSVADGCVGVPYMVTVTVHPESVGTNAAIEECSNVVLSYDLTGDVNIGSIFEWVATDNVDVEGETTVISMATSITDLLVNTTTTDQDVIYTVTPTSVADGCEGVPYTVTVTVRPEPVGTDASIDTCSNVALAHDLTGDVSIGSTFNWEVTSNVGGLTGVSTGIQTANSITDVLVNTTGVDQDVIYTVTPTSVADGCVGSDYIVTVTVHPEPVGTDATPELCSDDTFSHDLTGDVTLGSTFEWVAADNPDVTGETITTSTATSITDTLINPTNTDQIVVYAVTPTSVADGCVGSSYTVTVTVHPRPILLDANPLLVQCDNDTDGFSAFNLFEAGPLLSADHMNETFVFYDSNGVQLTAAEAMAYTNLIVTSETVQVDIITAFGCMRSAQVDLEVDTSQIPATFLRTFESCDDARTQVQNFDFSSVRTELETTGPGQIFPAGQVVSATFYESEADALAETGAIPDISDYDNLTDTSLPDISVDAQGVLRQRIWIRVDGDSANNCLGLIDGVELVVYPLPNINTISEIIECSDTADFDFDLTQRIAEIELNQPHALIISFHTSLADAQAGISAIPDPTSHNSITGQTIFVRAQFDSNGNGIPGDAPDECISGREMSFELIVNPNPVSIATPERIVLCSDQVDTEYDLTIREDEISAGATGLVFSYYETAVDLAAGNAIPDPTVYLSTTLTNTIIVQAETGLGCRSTVDLELQTVLYEDYNMMLDPLQECELETDNDGFDVFDLRRIEPEVLQNITLPATDFLFVYYENENDAIDGNTNTIPDPTNYTNSMAVNQTIYIRVRPIANDCFRVIPLQLIVNPVPEIAIADEYVICLLPDDTIIDPITDTFLPNPPIDTQLSATEYSFQWYAGTEQEVLDDPAAIILVGETESVYIPSEGGFYTVIATNIATGCTIPGTTFVHESYPPESITVTLTDAFSGTNTLEVAVVGNGEYEYKLDDGPWQSGSIFTNVAGGERTVFVRDIHNCNVLEEVKAVIDYPRFLTPNNDGYNDRWNIRSIDRQSDAVIYIFDRYGKLLKQLSPTGLGWDGTYNGELMPSSDYWFTLDYTEPNDDTRRQFKAHFALKR